MSITVTLFNKSEGVLTKQISLQKDGSIKSDGSACKMAQGTAQRVRLATMAGLGRLIDRMKSSQAIALGALRPGLPDRVHIVVKEREQELSGSDAPDIIARTSANVLYARGKQAVALLDYDTKAMSSEVAAKLERQGGFWGTITSILPELDGVATVERRSTSAGLFRGEKKVPGSDGVHVYVLVEDGADIDRFLKTLHDRCWLGGLGWYLVGKSGQLLERSVVDRMVGTGERLVFEGPPIIEPPLKQDRAARRPKVKEGGALDTLAACSPLTIIEKFRLHELKAKAAQQLAPQAASAREAFIGAQVKRLVEAGASEIAARHTVTRWTEGVLLPPVELPFDDDELASRTVADVLADPERFVGETLADPVEGMGYGRCCAKVMRRANGSVWIHSFAHGRSVYELKLDASTVRTTLDHADSDDVVKLFAKLALEAELDAAEIQLMCTWVAERAGVGKGDVLAVLKAARERNADERAREASERALAARTDSRPMHPAPFDDEPWLPTMDLLEGVLGQSHAEIPPERDIDGVVTMTRKLPVPNTHAFTSANEDEVDK